MTDQSIVVLVGSGVISASIGLIFFFVKSYFKRNEAEVTLNRKEIKETLEKLTTFQQKTAESYSKVYSKVSETTSALGAKIDFLTQQLEYYKNSTEVAMNQLKETVAQANKEAAKMEGRLDEHIDMIAKFIGTIGHLTRQMDAVFKYVDAPRATDMKQRG